MEQNTGWAAQTALGCAGRNDNENDEWGRAYQLQDQSMLEGRSVLAARCRRSQRKERQLRYRTPAKITAALIGQLPETEMLGTEQTWATNSRKTSKKGNKIANKNAAIAQKKSCSMVSK